MEIRGRSSPLLDSMMVRLDLPVTGSTFSCMVLPGTMSPNLTVPVHLGDDRSGEGVPGGQQVADLDLCPSATSRWAP
jgi:hypothetical protein